MVTLESTSDYWRIWFFVLEACGLAVQLVSASQAKDLPGRPKTDTAQSDDEFIALVLIHTWMLTSGKVLRSDVPPDELTEEELIDFWADEHMADDDVGHLSRTSALEQRLVSGCPRRVKF
jgi:hypothetical protein